MSAMLWCHICKEMAFIKSNLATVCTLDCGHMAKRKDISQEEANLKRDRPQYAKAPSRDSPRRSKRDKPAPPYEDIVVEKPRTAIPLGPISQPEAPRRSTSNVARTIGDLLDGKGDKSRTW